MPRKMLFLLCPIHGVLDHFNRFSTDDTHTQFHLFKPKGRVKKPLSKHLQILRGSFFPYDNTIYYGENQTQN